MSLRKRLLSFRYAFQGIADLFTSQPNARIHLAAAIFVISAGFYCHINQTEWALIILCIALVFALEAVNTALEYLTDLVSPDFHPLAGKAKDVAAAAVLIAAIGAMLVGILIFWPKLSALFHIK
ncbi:MAG: diacylglycerol kinase family protein [Bacteroidota bacterium]